MIIGEWTLEKITWSDKKESFPKATTDVTIDVQGYEQREYDAGGYLKNTRNEKWALQQGKIYFYCFNRPWFELLKVDEQEMVWKYVGSDELKHFRRSDN
jgi:hypothetical protein